MKCPYCVSEISDEALVCPQCRRDLYLFKPLLAQIADLERQVAETPLLEARIAALEAALAAGASPGSAAGDGDGAPTGSPWQAIAAWIAPLVLLLGAHGLIVLLFDLNTLYLRLVSLLIPLPFGFALLRRRPYPAVAVLAGAFAMALAAVLGMSWMTAQVDTVPVLPQDLRDWREFVEYAASIGLSLITGSVLGAMLRQRRRLQAQGDGRALVLARHLSKGKESAEKIQAMAVKLNDAIGTFTAIGATALSVYTGLKGVLGS